MNNEQIKVKVTSSGQMIDVVVYDKRLDVIQVVLGAGTHSVKCDLTLNRQATAYVGNAMGRKLFMSAAANK